MTLASKIYCTLYFFVITLTPYRHSKPKLNSNLAIAKICMVYGRLHELSLSKRRINYILVASFLSPCCRLFLKPSSLFIRQRCSILFGKNYLIRQTPLIRYVYSVYLFILASFEILLFAFRMLNDTSGL